ncbi:MAG: hypothetical protein RIT25_3074 [Planctomycetota bacterium]
MKPTTKADGRKPITNEALEDAILAIQKNYGDGSIMRLGDGVRAPLDGISTGSFGLDLCVGGRGLPKGRVVEIFGPESSGKTTLTLHVIANAQKIGGVCAFIDAEHALDPQYARRLGVDLDSLLISQPDHGEQALDITETLVKSGAVDVIVVDSVAALVPKAEIEGEMGDSFVGLQARLMSQALRKLTALVAKSNTMLIFINQIREKIGVMFGSPETTTGGRALKFYSSVRIDIRRIGQIKDGEEPIGARTKATVVKNKMAPPFKKCEFDILFNEGINRLGEVLDIGVEKGVIKRTGTWVSYGETRLGQGRDKARDFLKENPQLAKEIEEQVAKVVMASVPGANQGTAPAAAPAAGANGSGSAAPQPQAARPAGAAPTPAAAPAARGPSPVRPGATPVRPASAASDAGEDD